MKEVTMDHIGLFWTKIWTIASRTVMVLTLAIFVYNVTHNYQYYEAWRVCVKEGGMPVNQTMLGSQSSTFTCVRK